MQTADGSIVARDTVVAEDIVTSMSLKSILAYGCCPLQSVVKGTERARRKYILLLTPRRKDRFSLYKHDTWTGQLEPAHLISYPRKREHTF